MSVRRAILNLMNMLIIFGIAAGCILAERLWPAMNLPRVRAWWPRVLLINAIQLGITMLAGQTWNRWLNHMSAFHLSNYCHNLSGAYIIYLFSTFIYYWWHRFRHESQFLWRTLHQIHHSARRLEILTSFYKHPVEIWLNSIIGSLILYPLFGANSQMAAYYTILIAVGEFFYHWNINTPTWLGFVFQRPESHRIHHQFRHHTNNFADIPLWDMCFGTFKNPRRFKGRCGYESWREDRFEDMLLFRDVHAPGADKLAPLHFLPTCIGCSKRWACTAARAPQITNMPLKRKKRDFVRRWSRALERIALLAPTSYGLLLAVSAREGQDRSESRPAA
jgi:sterol desaturase/sphingolipid hydroxylase (fatty acid hydroxylase superfamily)